MYTSVKNLFFVVVFLLFYSFQAKGQFGLTNDAEMAKEAIKRKLIVVEDELSEKEIKKYTKKGTIKLVQEEYAKRNEKLKKYFTELWKVNKELVFKKESELAALEKSQSNEYVYVKLKYTYDMKRKKALIMGNDKIYIYSYYYFMLKLTDSNKSFGAITTRASIVKDIDYLTAINSLQYFVQFSAEGNKKGDLEEGINNNASALKDKTLLISDYLTQLTESEIKDNYPYKIKIAKDEEIIKMIQEKNPDYAYVYINHKTGSCGTRFNHMILDCANNAPLLLDKRNTLSLGTSSQVGIFDDVASLKSLLGKDGSQPSLFKQKYVKAKQLKNYANIIAGIDKDADKEVKGEDNELEDVKTDEKE